MPDLRTAEQTRARKLAIAIVLALGGLQCKAMSGSGTQAGAASRQAERIDLETDVVGAHESGSDELSQCFEFHTKAGVTYTVTFMVTNDTGNDAYQYVVYGVKSASGITLLPASNRPSLTTETRVFSATKTELAQLCATAGGKSRLYQYKFRIDPDRWHELAQDPETHEPNNSGPTAASIDVGTVVESALEDDGYDTKDCYAIMLERDVDYTLDFMVTNDIGTDAYGHVYLEAKSRDGHTLLQQQHLEGHLRAYYDMKAAADGEVELCITAGSGTRLYSYQFRVDPDRDHGLVQDSATYEPNNSAATAALVQTGTVIDSALEGNISDARDCFAFDLDAGVTYTISMRVTNDTGTDAYSSVSFGVDSLEGGTLLQTQRLAGIGAAYFEFTSPKTGQSVLCLDAGSQTRLYQYQLRIDPDRLHGLMQDASTFEPNNSPSTAFGVELGVTTNSELSSEDDDSVDCFAFDLEAKTYTLELMVTNDTGSDAFRYLSYSIVSASGTTLVQSSQLAGKSSAKPSFSLKKAEGATMCLKGSQGRLYAYEFTLNPA